MEAQSPEWPIRHTATRVSLPPTELQQYRALERANGKPTPDLSGPLGSGQQLRGAGHAWAISWCRACCSHPAPGLRCATSVPRSRRRNPRLLARFSNHAERGAIVVISRARLRRSCCWTPDPKRHLHPTESTPSSGCRQGGRVTYDGFDEVRRLLRDHDCRSIGVSFLVPRWASRRRPLPRRFW